MPTLHLHVKMAAHNLMIFLYFLHIWRIAINTKEMDLRFNDSTRPGAFL
jgi:hypothetical protein